MPHPKPSSAPAARPINLHRAVAAQSQSEKPATKLHKRSRSGCFTCRLRRKKCDEGHPSCKACTNLSLKCEYKRPMWWSSQEQRRMQKERVKDLIKKTKSVERRDSKDGASGFASISPPLIAEYDFNRAPLADHYDPLASHVHTPAFPPSATFPPQYAPYEVDVRTERQTFVNDVPLRHDSSVSTFNAMGPPQLHSTLPNFHGDDWLQEECFKQIGPYGEVDPGFPQPPNSASVSYFHTTTIPVEQHDRPLLDHFVENVLRMIFPILEVHQQGLTRAKAILNSLETNKTYLHCCLSVSAIHLKSSVGLSAEQIDDDIMRHRYEAISSLSQALLQDTDHEHILDAALAMIFFQSSVGAPDDSLPDIPWNDHFSAAANLVQRLDIQESMQAGTAIASTVNPFTKTLTAWIDILGATMMGTTPQFAHNYRTKHLSGSSSGLRELMGCDDRIMYLISEISCLESLKNDGRLDEVTLCHHVSALGAQLEHTEPADPRLDHPYTCTGSIQPDQLTKNMSTIFRLAARLYLCSLVPGFDRSQPSSVNLVSAIADTMQYIPAGPYGFDRSLVWPILMAGAFSTSTSEFRGILSERVAALGEIGDFGSFGRMYRLLQEVWRLSDDISISPVSDTGKTEDQNCGLKQEAHPYDKPNVTIGRAIKRQNLHWRDIMKRNDWQHLLI